MGSVLLLCPVLVTLAVRRYENVAYVVNRTLPCRVFLSVKVQNWLRRTEDRSGTTDRFRIAIRYLIPVRELCPLASGFARVFPFQNSTTGRVSRSCPGQATAVRLQGRGGPDGFRSRSRVGRRQQPCAGYGCGSKKGTLSMSIKS